MDKRLNDKNSYTGIVTKNINQSLNWCEKIGLKSNPQH